MADILDGPSDEHVIIQASIRGHVFGEALMAQDLVAADHEIVGIIDAREVTLVDGKLAVKDGDEKPRKRELFVRLIESIMPAQSAITLDDGQEEHHHLIRLKNEVIDHKYPILIVSSTIALLAFKATLHQRKKK